MQSFEFIYAENNRITFNDLGKSYWAKDYIEILAEQGIINRKSNNRFFPDDNIERSEFTKIVVDLLGLKYDEKFSNPFEDVQNNAWYYQHVMRAVKGGDFLLLLSMTYFSLPEIIGPVFERCHTSAFAEYFGKITLAGECQYG